MFSSSVTCVMLANIKTECKDGTITSIDEREMGIGK